MQIEQQAFDLWLRRDLVKRYSLALKDPLPVEFLRLLPLPGSTAAE